MSHRDTINGVEFFHGTYEGTVRIVSCGETVSVDMADLMEFVGRAMQQERIREIDEQTGIEFLRGES